MSKEQLVEKDSAKSGAGSSEASRTMDSRPQEGNTTMDLIIRKYAVTLTSYDLQTLVGLILDNCDCDDHRNNKWDMKKESLLHYAWNKVENSPNVASTLGAVLLKVFNEASGSVNTPVVHFILNMSKVKKCVTDVLLFEDDLKRTVIHWAVLSNCQNLECLGVFLKLAQHSNLLMALVSKMDQQGNTFLGYVGHGQKATKLILDYLTKYDVDTGLNTITISQPDVSETHVQSKLSIMMRAFTASYESMSDNNIEEDMNFDEDDAEKTFQEIVQKRPENFELLHEDEPFKVHQSAKDVSLLTAISNKRYLSVIIDHPYTKAYLEACWIRNVRNFAIPCLLIYFVLLGSLTFNVASHYKAIYYTNMTTAVHMITDLPIAMQVTAQYIMLISSILAVVIEFIQILAKGRHYWKQPNNYADILVAVGGFVVSLLGINSYFSPGLYQIGVITMCVGWVNAAWVFTKLDFGCFRWFSCQFSMIFRVMGSILLFLPVFGFFLFIMALNYNSLLHNQQAFNNLRASIMKSLAITIGELDFSSIFYPEEDSEEAHFVGLTSVVFVVFIGIMNIAVMNILVGLAVGDIQELLSNSKVYAFKSSVDLAMECQVTMTWIRKCCTRRTRARSETHPVADSTSSESDYEEHDL